MRRGFTIHLSLTNKQSSMELMEARENGCEQVTTHGGEGHPFQGLRFGTSQGVQPLNVHSESFCVTFQGRETKNYDRCFVLELVPPMGKKNSRHAHKTRSWGWGGGGQGLFSEFLTSAPMRLLPLGGGGLQLHCFVCLAGVRLFLLGHAEHSQTISFRFALQSFSIRPFEPSPFSTIFRFLREFKIAAFNCSYYWARNWRNIFKVIAQRANNEDADQFSNTGVKTAQN